MKQIPFLHKLRTSLDATYENEASQVLESQRFQDSSDRFTAQVFPLLDLRRVDAFEGGFDVLGN